MKILFLFTLALATFGQTNKPKYMMFGYFGYHEDGPKLAIEPRNIRNVHFCRTLDSTRTHCAGNKRTLVPGVDWALRWYAAYANVVIGDIGEGALDTTRTNNGTPSAFIEVEFSDVD